MDGPFAFTVHRGNGTSARIAWGKSGKETSVGTVDVAVLLESALTAGRLVAAACRAQEWGGQDLDNLERAIVRSAA